MNSLISRRWRAIALIVITLLALGLRLFRLDTQSLWNDEGTSVALAQRDLPTITRNAADDIHPPLYYYLLHLWVKVAGISEFSVRFLSAATGLALVLATYALARRLYGQSVALLAALFAAISPFQVYYSQETRMYVLTALLGLLSVLAFERFLSCLSRRVGGRPLFLAIGAYVLVTIFAVYTHYFAFAVLLAQNVSFLIWLDSRHRTTQPRWPKLLRAIAFWATTQTLILLCYLPWLVLCWPSLQNWPAVSRPMSLGHLLMDVSRVFSLGLTVGVSARTRMVASAISLLALAGIFCSAPAAKGQNRVTRWGFRAWLTPLYLLVPILVMYGISLRRPMYKPKLLLLAAPAYHVLQAGGVLVVGSWAARATRSQAWRVIVEGTLAVIVCAASARSLANLYTGERYFRDDYRGIVQYINGTCGPRDAILINAPSQIETLNYYYKGHLPEYPVPRQRPMDMADTQAVLEDIIARHSRIYAVYWATNESDPERFIETWLAQHCFKALDRWFGNVRFVVYSVSGSEMREMAQPLDCVLDQVIRLRGYTLSTPELRSGDILQLTLFWEALASIEERYKVFIHVVDGRGNIVGQRDSEPGGGARITTSWEPGELVADNHGVLIQPGTPPGEHRLRIGLYSFNSGQRLSVTQDGRSVGDFVELARLNILLPKMPPPIGALDIQHKKDARWGSLRLIGYSLHRLGCEHEPNLSLRPGDEAKLVLFWRKETDGDAGEEFVAALSDRRGEPIWEQALRVAGGTFHPGAWRDGEIVRDLHQLHLPPDLRPGKCYLVLRANNWARDRNCTLESMAIER